jgi:GH3 auxin-responsive promoter
MGRAGVCDLAGEKLNEVFVRQALQPLLQDNPFLLVPNKTGYVLIAENSYQGLAARVEEALCGAHHYKIAHDLGQLKPVTALAVPRLSQKLQSFHQKAGMKQGDIKDVSLITDTVQGERLLAFMVGTTEDTPLPSALREGA